MMTLPFADLTPTPTPEILSYLFKIYPYVIGILAIIMFIMALIYLTFVLMVGWDLYKRSELSGKKLDKKDNS
jgi:hypothetical protein